MKTLFKLFLVFLPFTYGLTIDVGFPLKISEIILLTLLFILFVKGRISITIFKKFPEILIFLLLVTISFFINLNENYEADLFPFRISPNIDSLLRLIYIYINFFAFIVTYEFINKDIFLLKSWVYGALMAAFYGWYLFFSSALGFDYILLPGMSLPLQEFSGFIRSGTFHEGNYFALYLLLSGSIAWLFKLKKTSIFLFVSIFSTFSTTGIIGIFLFLGIYLSKVFFKKQSLINILYVLPLVIVIGIYSLNNPTFKSVLVGKLQSIKNVNRSNGSAADRYSTSKAAFKMGIDNCFFGVGPYKFGLNYLEYLDFDDFETINKKMKHFIRYEGKRKIPNNIYFEVFSEYGLFSFFFFLFFLFHLYKRTGVIKDRSIKAGFVVLLFCFNAFPSFIMLFIWVFFAIPLASTSINNEILSKIEGK